MTTGLPSQRQVIELLVQISRAPATRSKTWSSMRGPARRG